VTYAELQALAAIVTMEDAAEMSFGNLVKSLAQLESTMARASDADAFNAKAGVGLGALEITSRVLGGVLSQWKRINNSATMSQMWTAVTGAAKAAVSRGTSTHLPGQVSIPCLTHYVSPV
jgi:hypothetical protein